MRTPETYAGRLTEDVMRSLRAAGVLKDDEPDRPHHYNRAWSTVLEAIQNSTECQCEEVAPVIASMTIAEASVTQSQMKKLLGF